MKILFAFVCLFGFSALALGEDAKPIKVAPADAKSHVGDLAVVCGLVVDSAVPKYGLAGHGKPVSFYLDQPGPNAVFYFSAFGKAPDGPKLLIDAYKNKRVCVTGKIDMMPANGLPFIMATDRDQIKTEAAGK
jgi:hypothetical protein